MRRIPLVFLFLMDPILSSSSRRTALLALAGFSGCPLLSLAQTSPSYPQRPIHLVVPYPAGGATDVLARLLGVRLGELLGQPVVIENRGGAGTIVGASYVAKSAPDGYTLLLTAGTTTFTINPAIQSALPYDPVTSFEPIGAATRLPLVLLARADFAASNLKELVKLAQAKPEALNYGSFGTGSTAHFAAELLWRAIGIQVAHVPYKGSAPALSDLIGGQIPLAMDTVTAAVPHIQSGKLKALAVTTARHSAALPQVPSVAEQGFADVDVDAWSILAAPRGLPAAVRTRLQKALADVVATPEVRQQLLKQGFEPAYANAAATSTRIERELPVMRAIAARAHIKPD